MAHAQRNYPTKKSLKEAVKNGEDVYVQPSMFGTYASYGGNQVVIEGPWEYHKWYAAATVDPATGKVLTVK